jgi:protein-tyrosine phosphatase
MTAAMNGVRVTQTDRRIPLRNCANLRDVGGYPAADGRTTRWRTLLRSGSLHFAGDDAARTLADCGVRTVLDLRTFEEADYAPSPPLADGTVTRRISLIAEGARGLDPRLDAVYRYLIGERGDTIARVVQMLAAPGALPALVHCSAGKDRTGIVVGLVLSAVGVPDEVVAEDYALSAACLGPRTPQIISQVRASVGLADGGPADHGDLLDSPAGLFRQVLDWTRTAGGSAAGYLQAHGVTAEELAALRENLTA